MSLLCRITYSPIFHRPVLLRRRSNGLSVAYFTGPTVCMFDETDEWHSTCSVLSAHSWQVTVHARADGYAEGASTVADYEDASSPHVVPGTSPQCRIDMLVALSNHTVASKRAAASRIERAASTERGNRRSTLSKENDCNADLPDGNRRLSRTFQARLSLFLSFFFCYIFWRTISLVIRPRRAIGRSAVLVDRIDQRSEEGM